MLLKMNLKSSVLFVTILAVALTRLIPHWPNFTAVGAIAIFSGAVLTKSNRAILLPLIAIFISDLLINNILYSAYYEGFVFFGESSPWVYSSLILMAVLSHFSLKNLNVISIFGVVLSGSLLFFIITNFGAWMGNPLYTQDINGLLIAYEAGLPFFLNSILGNLFFSAVLFGLYHYATVSNLKWAFIK
jgi:hypothetical protein